MTQRDGKAQFNTGAVAGEKSFRRISPAFADTLRDITEPAPNPKAGTTEGSRFMNNGTQHKSK
ncbi:MAG: hypothetical protein PW788_00900 [Micavibrio sp.]|nr:hypothetical protein [Micavibrio sp.]